MEDIMAVKKVSGGYALFSKTTGKRLSKVYKSKDSPSLKKREKQVQFFKNDEKHREDHGGEGIPVAAKRKAG